MTDDEFNKKYLALLKEAEQELRDYIFSYEAAMDGSTEGFNRCGHHGYNFFDCVKELQKMTDDYDKEKKDAKA